VVSSIIDDNFCTTREQVSILFCGVLNDDDYETYDFSERLAVFNSFLVAVQNQLFLHGGIMDKFTGTACLGFFQGTNITKSPLLTAQGIRKALLELNHEFVKNGKKPLKAGIGIATGPVVLGYIGASKRRDFTSIGNTVNMAARLETFAINSTSEVSVFLDEVTFRQHEVFISDNDNFHFHCHTGISLKGKQGEQIIYELL
jgi:class 3 adenylate cyclase